jgi:hypothetical protein
MPAIWFLPNTNKLCITFTGEGLGAGLGFSDVPLLIGFATQIQINAVGPKVHLLLNNTVTNIMDLPGTRTSGDYSVLFISSPWNNPANASI